MNGRIVFLTKSDGTSYDLPKTLAKAVYLGDGINESSKNIETKFQENDTQVFELYNYVTNILERLEALELNSGGNPIPAESVDITPKTKNITIGESVNLTVNVLPENATNRLVTWSSNNGNVTVAGGKVTGVSVGSSVVTATTHNGLTATCNITITTEQILEPITDSTFYEIKAEQYTSGTTWTPTIGTESIIWKDSTKVTKVGNLINFSEGASGRTTTYKPFATTMPSYTIEFVGKFTKDYTSDTTGRVLLSIMEEVSPYAGFILQKATSQTVAKASLRHGTGASLEFIEQVHSDLTFNKMLYVQVVCNTRTITMYINGNVIGTKALTGDITSSGIIGIGTYDKDGRYTQGSIGVLRLHNRALTKAELDNNRNYDTTKYGI